MPLTRTLSGDGWQDKYNGAVYLDDGTAMSFVDYQKIPPPIFEIKNDSTTPSVQKLVKRMADGEVPPDIADRKNSGKPEFHYILYFPKTTELLARIFELGAAKYSENNWRKGGNTDKSYLAAAMRHLMKLMGHNQEFDEEFKTNHIGHAIWNLMVMFELNDHDILESKEAFDKALEGFLEAKNNEA